MIDKNFYLENLSAFDLLIVDDRKKAEQVIFRVFSMLQRDKIWLRDVATEEEIFEEDKELLLEIEEELKELDLKYEFRFEAFYQLVQQEMKKLQGHSSSNLSQVNEEDDVEEDPDDDYVFDESEDEFDIDDLYLDDDDDDADGADAFSHLSDEELSLIEGFIISSAKKKFNFAEFLENFEEDTEEFVAGEILLPIISCKAFGETDIEIAQKIRPSLMMLGLEMENEEIIQMIHDKGNVLGAEILAFKVAADSLQQGAHPKDIVRQLELLLHV